MKTKLAEIIVFSLKSYRGFCRPAEEMVGEIYIFFNLKKKERGGGWGGGGGGVVVGLRETDCSCWIFFLKLDNSKLCKGYENKNVPCRMSSISMHICTHNHMRARQRQRGRQKNREFLDR